MRSRGWLVAMALACLPALAAAQVETDGSLGPAGPVPGGLLPDGSLATYRIDESLGQRRGGNLFHSFSSFSVPSGATAAFTADLPTDRVLARVSGTSASVISGRLRSVIPGADLYLMNPNGVIFSGGSSLDVDGSFYVSAANSLRLSDGTRFAAAVAEGEVLSTAAPAAWGFLGPDVGQVTLRGCGLCAVAPGQTFSAVGGVVAARQQSFAQATVVSAPGGSIEFAATRSAGEVPLDLAGFDARGREAGSLGEVRLGPGARLTVEDPLGGSSARGRIVIRSGTFQADTASIATGSSVSAFEGGRDIDIEATEAIRLGAGVQLLATSTGEAAGGSLHLASRTISVSAATVLSDASGAARGGALDVAADQIELSSGALLWTRSVDEAVAGALGLRAGTLLVHDGAQVLSETLSSAAGLPVEILADELRLEALGGIASSSRASGAGAELHIAAGAVTQSTGGRISTDAASTGRGGNVRLDATSLVLHGAAESDDPGGVFARALDAGDSGDIAVTAHDVTIEGGAQISATTESAGRGGDVSFDVQDALVARGRSAVGPSGVFARSGLGPGATATGHAGNLAIDARRVRLEEGAELSAQGWGDGSAGEIRVRALESLTLAGVGEARSSINAKTERAAGGRIQIDTASLRVENGAEISASTLDSGRAGDIAIDAREVRVGGGAETAEPAGIFAQSNDQRNVVGAGAGGNIEIDASELVEIDDGGIISAGTRGAGTAGDVTIRGAKRVEVRDGALSARAEDLGEAGSVTLSGVGVVAVGSRGSIRSETQRFSRGGDVSIQARREVVVASGGQISASSAGTGDAGSISIDAGDQLIVRDGGRITTQADTAFGGNIDLRARELLYVRDGEITTSVNAGAGNGGNIHIDPKFVVLDNGRIEARANAGNGGNITIQTDHFLADVDSAVDASSQLGIDGQVQITAPETDLSGELAQLSSDYLDASSQLSRACAARSGGQGTFRVAGGAKQGAPDAPLDAASSGTQAAGCPEPSR